MEWEPAVAVALAFVLAGCGSFAAGGTTREPTQIQMREDPHDPGEDVLGWEEGYWYNETIAVDQSDGLSPGERGALVARTMARVEQVRRLEFRSPVPVDVVSRERFAHLGPAGNVSEARRTFVNAKFEALFMVNESTEAIDVRQQRTTTAVKGFYSPRQDVIVLIESGGNVRIDETTLAHELTHALQDQQFNLTEFDRPTREAHNAVDGLVEGDANLVQFRYEKRCEGAWNDSCVTPPRRPAEGGAETLGNVGPYLLRYQPYSDGPAFLQAIRDRGGWERVNDLYDDPPSSTEQTIHPDLYGEDQPATVRVEDRSTEAWNRLEVAGRPDYAEVGEAGLASMLVRPALETQGRVEVVTAKSFFTGNASFDPYSYGNPYSAGWDGDRLVDYTSQQTAPGEFGYVYKTVWDSEAEAREFADGYRELLEIEGARQVESRSHTWHIPEGTGFGDAYFVRVRGDTVTIVNGPTVESLSEIYREIDGGSTDQ